MTQKVFDIIGENFNATRRLKGSGPRIVRDGAQVGVAYAGEDGTQRLLDVTAICPADPAKLATFQIPHVAHAVRTRNLDYIAWLVQSQVKAGANIIDLCIDEIAIDPAERHRIMEWLLPVVQGVTDAIIAIDSSDPGTILAGLKVHDGARSRPAINSVSLEAGRQELIGLAKSRNALLFANASGSEGMPADAAERVRNLVEMMRLMDEAGIPMGDRYLDPLAFPVSTGSAFGGHYLDAVRELRRRYPEVHLFGGHSNASFGLPKRKIANHGFIILSILAGCDTLMIDPLLNPPAEYIEFKYAADLVLGADENALRYMAAFRSTPSPAARRAAARGGAR